MSRRPVGVTAMSDAERQQRRRDKAKALREAEQRPPISTIQSATTQPARTPSPAGRPDNSGGADYPRMLYHSDGRTTVVDTPEQHDRLKPDGWGMAPLAVHRQRPVTHHGFLGTDNPFVWPMRRW
jgi:hypothetical protein